LPGPLFSPRGLATTDKGKWFGTDQEYLLLKRLWPRVKPAVVVLVFCGMTT
jgi:hypothetical protein